MSDNDHLISSLIGKRIKEARYEKGYSQEALGALVGITKAAISQYENGIHVPTIEKGQALAKALDVSFNWLIGYSAYKYKIEAQHLAEIYVQLNDERKKALYEYAEYLKRKEDEEHERVR